MIKERKIIKKKRKRVREKGVGGDRDRQTDR